MSLLPTTELKTGDIVRHYGVRLRLTDRREYGATHFPTASAVELPVVVFDTEYVGPVDPDYNPADALGGYGRQMIGGLWKIQGNRHATWAIED